MTHVSFVEKAAACCPCMAFDGFWAEDVAKRQQKRPRSHFKQNFRNKAVVADMPLHQQKTWLKNPYGRSCKYIKKASIFSQATNLKTPTYGSSWVHRMALYLWKKKLTKILVIFFPKRRLLFWFPWLLPWEFFYNLLRFYFRKTFFFRRFVVFFSGFRWEKFDLPKARPQRGKNPQWYSERNWPWIL